MFLKHLTRGDTSSIGTTLMFWKSDVFSLDDMFDERGNFE